MAAPKPSLSALLVCDMVIDDKVTNKKSLIGTFTDIWGQNFPLAHHKMGVYVSLTDAEGDYELVLRLVRSATDQPIVEANLSVRIMDRLATSDFGINLPVVQFPEPGRYEVQLYANREFLGRKDFNVLKPEMRSS